MLHSLLLGDLLLVQLLGQLPVFGDGASIVPGIGVCEVELEEAVDQVLLRILDVVLEDDNLRLLLLLLGLNLVGQSSKPIDLFLHVKGVLLLFVSLELSCSPCLPFSLELRLDLVQLVSWVV